MSKENLTEPTRAIARFVVETDERDIPEQAFEHARVAFMDWFAVTIAGKDEPLVDKLIRYGEVLGGNRQASILGRSMKTNVIQAALVNGSASHALDYDDTMVAWLGHPSVALFPGLLAFGEWQEKNGRDFLAAYLIGLQAGVCVASCAGMEHYLVGWHSTATIGRLAAAAACARLMGLDELQTLYAIGIAGTHASGLKRVLGTMCKPLHAGSAAQGGLMAAMLAQDGFTSATDILEGPHGFFVALKGQSNPDAIESMREVWAVEQLAQKYHAACHFAHSPIEAVLRITKEKQISPDEIESIRIYVSQVAQDLAGKPEPATGLEGKFSIRYSVANALVRGETGMSAYTDEKVHDPQVRSLMGKVTIFVEETLPGPGTAARAEVKTRSGQVHELLIDVMEEIPELEVKREKVRSKFTDLCQPVFGQVGTESLARIILGLDRDINMKRFMEQILV